MTNSQIFKKAHELARNTVKIVGNYMIAFSLALKEIYSSLKSSIKELTNEVTGKLRRSRPGRRAAKGSTFYALPITAKIERETEKAALIRYIDCRSGAEATEWFPKSILRTNGAELFAQGWKINHTTI